MDEGQSITVNNSIQILPADAINKDLWDSCIRSSSQRLIYAYGFYLDQLCDQWSGLIIGDYDAVMPLPWRKKWGIRYYYAPPFIQQLGLFGQLQDSSIPIIFQYIKKFAWYGDLHFNVYNTALVQQHAIQPKNNYYLPLTMPHAQLVTQYTPMLIKNLQRASKKQLHYDQLLTIEASIQMYRNIYGSRFQHIREQDYERLIHLCNRLEEEGNCIIRTASDSNGSVLALAVLLKEADRLYHLINVTTESGKKSQANHWLMNEMIREFSETGWIFDFEGSMLPGVAQFYQQFGASVQHYFHYRRNAFFGISYPIKSFRIWLGQPQDTIEETLTPIE